MQGNDGLLTFPYTHHDWIIVLMAVSGYLYRMLLWKKTPDVGNPALRDWVSTFTITAMLTLGLYELAIHKKWELPLYFLPFGVVIILVKDLSDWLFMSREGKKFVMKAFKEMLSAALGRAGYFKKEE